MAYGGGGGAALVLGVMKVMMVACQLGDMNLNLQLMISANAERLKDAAHSERACAGKLITKQ